MGIIVEGEGFIDWERTRADEAHFAAEHIIELRQFIDGVFADESTEWGDAGVIGYFEDRAGHFIELGEFMFFLFGIGDHGSEFVHAEGFSIEAAAHLVKEDGTGGSDPDEESDDGQRESQQDQEDQSTGEIESAFGDTLPIQVGSTAEDESWLAVEVVDRSSGDIGFDEIGKEPDLDTLEFTEMDNFFHIAEQNILGGDDDGVGGVVMNGLREVVERFRSGIKNAGDFEFTVASGGEMAFELIDGGT